MGLARMGVRVPTKVQSAVIPVLMERKNLSASTTPGSNASSSNDVVGNEAKEPVGLRHHRTSALIVGGTGTGKTLAYVAPLVPNKQKT